MAHSNMEVSLRQETTFRHVYDETHSYFKQSRRNDRGVPLDPAKYLLLQRVPREETETSVYTFPYEFILVDDLKTSDLVLDSVSCEDLTEKKVESWDVEERDESDMKRAVSPHTVLQKPVKQMKRYLEADLLGKLAIYGTKGHLVKRQLQIDRLAKQMRIVFASLPMSQSRMTNFLFLENLTKDLLSSYLEGLRAVHIRWPTYVEEQLSVDPGPLLKRMNINHVKQFIATEPPVIPLAPVPKVDKVQPVIIIIPHCEGENSRRFKAFTDMLRSFAELKIMSPIRLPKQPSPETDPARSVQEFLCSEIKHIHLLRPKTPIFVLGWGTGASLAAPSISPSLGSARGFIALGMPLQGGHGRRGYCEDKLINALSTPSLFVTGVLSQRGTVAQFELLRSRLSVESRLLVLGGADHILRLTSRWKWRYSVTQTQVDRQIVMEIRQFIIDFIGSASPKSVTSASPPHSSPAPRPPSQPSLAPRPASTVSQFPATSTSFHPRPHHFPTFPSQTGYRGPAVYHNNTRQSPVRGRPMQSPGGNRPNAPGVGGMGRGRSNYRRTGNRRSIGVYRGNRHNTGERRGWRAEQSVGPMPSTMQSHHRHHPYDSASTPYRPHMGQRHFQERSHEQYHPRVGVSAQSHSGRTVATQGFNIRGNPGPGGPIGREIDNSYDQETAAAIQSIT